MIYVCWVFCEIASGEIVWDKKETLVITAVCIPCSNETLLLFVCLLFFFRKSFKSGILVWEHWSGMQLSQARFIAQCSSLLHFVSKLANRTRFQKRKSKIQKNLQLESKYRKNINKSSEYPINPASPDLREKRRSFSMFSGFLPQVLVWVLLIDFIPFHSIYQRLLNLQEIFITVKRLFQYDFTLVEIATPGLCNWTPILAISGYLCTSAPVGTETFPRGNVEVKPRKYKIFYRQRVGKKIVIFIARSSWK